MEAIMESGPAVLCGRWTDMWNRLVPASEIVSTDCRVYFSRMPQTAHPTATTGPDELQSAIDTIRERLAGVRYSFGDLELPLMR
jgi:hypothetical protein